MANKNSILAFCHLRKTGGVSFNQLLRRQHGGAHLDANVRYHAGTKCNQPMYYRENLERDQWVYPRLKSIAGHYLCPAVDYGRIGERFRWVTILRHPVHRYVSHYGQHVEKIDSEQGFESWMESEKYHNDQVKTIAGSPDLEKAKHLLATKFVVGFLEYYELSMRVIRDCLPEFGLDVKYVGKSNFAKGVVDSVVLAEKHEARIRANNQLDQELYDFALNELWLRRLKALDQVQLEQAGAQQRVHAPTWSEHWRVGWARVKRNVIYKPFVYFNQSPTVSDSIE